MASRITIRGNEMFWRFTPTATDREWLHAHHTTTEKRILCRIAAKGLWPHSYPELPQKVKGGIKKASVYKRLVDHNDCNPKCVIGFAFALKGEFYQKCRYMAFLPTLSKENNSIYYSF